MKIRIAGIDPGIHSMGWVIGEADLDKRKIIFNRFYLFLTKGRAKVGFSESIDARFYHCLDADDFYRKIEKAALELEGIDVMVIEKPVFKGYPTEVLINIGWVSHIFWDRGAQIIYVNPSTWKKEVVGKGNADKSMVRRRAEDFEVVLVDDTVGKVRGHISGRDTEHLFDAMCIAFYAVKVSEGNIREGGEA